jgi:small subunit ribosomal protein S17
MQSEERGVRRVKQGVVISNKMEKTAVVLVSVTETHPRYRKTVKRRKKFYAHAETPVAIGDEVTIVESRPLSKLKRWRIVAESAN